MVAVGEGDWFCEARLNSATASKESWAEFRSLVPGKMWAVQVRFEIKMKILQQKTKIPQQKTKMIQQKMAMILLKNDNFADIGGFCSR